MIEKTSGKTQYFFQSSTKYQKKIIKSHTSWYDYGPYLKFMNVDYTNFVM